MTPTEIITLRPRPLDAQQVAAARKVAAELPADLGELVQAAMGRLAAGKGVTLVEEPKYLSLAQAAKAIGADEDYVAVLFDSGRLSTVTRGGRRLVTQSEVEEFRESRALLDEVFAAGAEINDLLPE